MIKNAKPIPLRNYDETAWVDDEVFDEIIGMGPYFILRDAGTKSQFLILIEKSVTMYKKLVCTAF